MSKRRQNKFLSYVKMWQIIAGGIIAMFVVAFYVFNAIDGYIEDIVDKRVQKELKQYPPPEVMADIKVSVGNINEKFAILNTQVASIDGYLKALSEKGK